MKWIIRKRYDHNPARPWQLWLSTGEAMGLKAERSRWEYVVQAMTRYEEANS